MRTILLSGVAVSLTLPSSLAMGATIQGIAASDPAGRVTTNLVLTLTEGGGPTDFNLVNFDVDFVAQTDQFVDTVFEVETSTSATTGYALTASFRNQTGIDWAQMQLRLGFGTGSNFIGSLSDGLTFVSVPNPGTFSTATLSDDILSFSSPTLGPIPGTGGLWNPEFYLLVPGLSLIPTSAETNDGYRFTLRAESIPTVARGNIPIPEPTAGAMLSLLVATIGRRRRR